MKGGAILKTSKGLLFSICIVMFLVSCASAPEIPFETIVAEADSRVGESVILGGIYFRFQNTREPDRYYDPANPAGLEH